MDCIKTILIVGVNSTIGSAILNIYSEKKYICFGTYNKEPLSNEIRNKCKNVIQCDLSSHEGIQKLQKFCQELKPYHIVYLPGYIDAKSLEENSLECIHKTFNTNLFAYWLVISECLTYMKERRYGRFLSLSSIGSKFGGGDGRFNYTTSKKLLEFFPKDFKKVAHYNIFINNIICGVTDTNILKKKKNESILQRVQLIPVGRLAQPVEIALCCYQLCSEQNTFQTLSNVTIAGGE